MSACSRMKWRAVKRKDAGEYSCLPRGGATAADAANATLIVVGAAARPTPSALSARRDDLLQDIHDVPQADQERDEDLLQGAAPTTAAPTPAAPAPRTMARREGDGVVLACPVAGPSTSTPFWIKDGAPFRVAGRAAVMGRSLSIQALRLADAGNYTCTVANRRGSDASSVLLRVFSE